MYILQCHFFRFERWILCPLYFVELMLDLKGLFRSSAPLEDILHNIPYDHLSREHLDPQLLLGHPEVNNMNS
jgi:hypothetical protein